MTNIKNNVMGPEVKTVEQGEVLHYSVEIPLTEDSDEFREKLLKVIASKASVLKKAVGTDSLPVVFSEGKIRFPWFALHGLDGEADAYNRLISAICKMAREQKRVTAKESNSENDKLTMRLFLIRLGFIGDEYKTARKILLRNLSGNSSRRTNLHGEPKTAHTPVIMDNGMPAMALASDSPCESPVDGEVHEH